MSADQSEYGILNITGRTGDVRHFVGLFEKHERWTIFIEYLQKQL